MNIANHPCDLCESPGKEYISVPKRYYPLLPHSCLYALGRELDRLWLCGTCGISKSREENNDSKN